MLFVLLKAFRAVSKSIPSNAANPRAFQSLRGTPSEATLYASLHQKQSIDKIKYKSFIFLCYHTFPPQSCYRIMT